MHSRKKKEIDVSTVIIIVLGIFMVCAFITEHIIYWFKGSAPVEIYIATISPIIAEIVALCTLKINKRKYEYGNINQEEGQG